MHRKLISFAALAVTIAAIAGVGYAAIPGSNGVISGCYDAQGRLRVIDAQTGETCPTGQTPLTWNQQGPQGPPGPQGAAGPQGPRGFMGLQGPPGPVTAYHAFANSSGGVVGNDWAVVGGTLNLPPGTWLLTGKVTADGGGGGDSALHCRLDAGSSQFRDVSAVEGDGRADLLAVVMGVYSSSSSFSVWVPCRDLDTEMKWRNIRIFAVKVSDLVQVGL